MAQCPTERLSIGYYKVVDGECVNDPLLVVDWKSNILIEVQISQYLRPELQPCDPYFAREFFDEVWARHFDGLDAL